MESDILQVRFTEEGKKYIRKFVSISYVLFCLVFITSGISIYLGIKFIIKTYEFDQIIRNGREITFFNIGLQIIALVSNVFYLRFPIRLLKCLDAHDESGANRSFALLLKAGIVYLIFLFLSLALSVCNIFFSVF